VACQIELFIFIWLKSRESSASNTNARVADASHHERREATRQHALHPRKLASQ
jgi:hypothetical protein